MEGKSEVKCTMDAPNSVVVTYYEGDINTVVDEHFFRALNKNNMPKDLSTKPRHRAISPPTEVAAPCSWSSSWPSTAFSQNPLYRSGQSQTFSTEGPLRFPSVIVPRPEAPSASWNFPKNDTMPYLPSQPSRPTAAPSLHILESGSQMAESTHNYYWH